MQSRKRCVPTQVVLMAVSLAAVLICAAGTQAMAAQDNYKGWFVALDLANSQPNGFDHQYATLVDTTTGFEDRAVIDNDADFTWALKVGYSWGDLGGLGVSYWSFDNEDEVEDTVTGAYVYPTVFGSYGYNSGGAYYLSPPTDFQATSNTEASTIDIDYFRPMKAGEKLTINWIAGLRSATFEEDRTFDGIDTYGATYIQAKHIESEAFGVKLGAEAIFGFTDHFSLQGTMAFSLMQADVDAEATQDASGVLDSFTSSDNNVRGEIRDYDLRAVWSWKAFDVWVGYGGQTWDGLVTDPLNGSCCGASGGDTSQRDSIAFNQVHAGVAYRFGGD